MVARRVAAGRLHRLHRRVYAVGHRALTGEAWLLSAVLACGDAAVLSHRSAAAVWGLVPAREGPVDVTSPTRRGRAAPTIRAHRASLDPDDVTRRRALAITTPARTLLDLAAVTDAAYLQRAVDTATRRFSFDELSRAADRTPSHPGIKRLRETLITALPDADRARTELETRMRRLIADAGLPRPEVNAPIGSYEADFAWRAQRLIVEVDG